MLREHELPYMPKKRTLRYAEFTRRRADRPTCSSNSASAAGWKISHYRVDEYRRLYTKDERSELLLWTSGPGLLKPNAR